MAEPWQQRIAVALHGHAVRSALDALGELLDAHVNGAPITDAAWQKAGEAWMRERELAEHAAR